MIEDFFLRVAVLPWDSDAAQQYGQLRATLEREGQPMGNLDAEWQYNSAGDSISSIFRSLHDNSDSLHGRFLQSGERSQP
jgi:hypothetical protein